jgi:hypothetical protein
VDGSSLSPASTLSVGGLLYQAECLVERLSSFTSDDYPPQTLAIAQIFRLLAERSRSQLSKLDTPVAAGLSLGEEGRARDIGNIVQTLHSYLRYLQASAPLQTPPGIQQAITTLIETHVLIPAMMNGDSGHRDHRFRSSRSLIGAKRRQQCVS